jgi:hypothetical protein
MIPAAELVFGKDIAVMSCRPLRSSAVRFDPWGYKHSRPSVQRRSTRWQASIALENHRFRAEYRE